MKPPSAAATCVRTLTNGTCAQTPLGIDVKGLVHGRPDTDGRLTVHTLVTISHIDMAVPAAAIYVTKDGPLDVLGEKLVFEPYESMKVSARGSHACVRCDMLRAVVATRELDPV